MLKEKDRQVFILKNTAVFGAIFLVISFFYVHLGIQITKQNLRMRSLQEAAKGAQAELALLKEEHNKLSSLCKIGLEAEDLGLKFRDNIKYFD